MLYLRYTPIQQNLWAVKRHRDGGHGEHIAKIAEIALSLEGHCTLIPVASYALDLEELDSITAFMHEAHKKDSAIVLGPALRPGIPYSKCVR